MTRKEQIAALRKQRNEIERQIDVLVQEELAEHAVAPVGAMIEWQHAPNQKRRGRVTALRDWLNGVAYVVQIVRRDGADGGTMDVYPYHNPVPYSSGS